MNFEGVYIIDGKLATKSIAPGTRVYGEKLVGKDGAEYRMWDLFRSKLAAAIHKGLKELPIKPGSVVLYLGASSGTTPSHVADIVGESGMVFCIEFSPRSMRDLINVCEARPNMVPMLADARKPDEYAEVGEADVIYQDVAQPDQASILIKNSEKFLKPKGYALIAVKSQSIDVTVRPKETFDAVKKELSQHFRILQEIELSPFDKDHLFLLLQKK
jgi:fibrillarin-like pre-rRNA processing protein